MPDFERWEQPPEPERCSFCGRANDDLLFLDGWNPEGPGTALLVCDTWTGWGHRTQLAAGYAAENI